MVENILRINSSISIKKRHAKFWPRTVKKLGYAGSTGT